MSNPLANLSDKISSLVTSSASVVCAVRTASNRHVTGVLVQGDAVVTISQSLPLLDFYTAFFASGAVVPSRQVTRDPVTDLAVLKLDDAVDTRPLVGILPPVGSLAVIVSVELAGAPTARLAMVHHLARTSHGMAPILDVFGGTVETGAAIFDPEGRLIGLASAGPDNTVVAIPAASLIRLAGGANTAATPSVALEAPPVQVQPQPAPARSGSRAWIGVSLQPTTVPDHLISKAGQPSGRMVMNLADGGPADRAGLKVGDVVLTLNGNATSGPNALRAFLSSERIGSAIELKLMRDGVLMVTTLVVGSQPN
jgi:S1-C subfamily serine protease